jgi:hypothetical protein
MRLLLATPCQHVITDAENSMGHSLIAVFHDVGIRVPPETVIPSNALLPKEWAVFSKWQADSEEEAKRNYSLVFEAFWPDGTPLAKQELASKPLVERKTAFIFRNTGFPMGQDGNVRVVLSLRSDGVPAHGPVELNISVRLQRDLVV